MSVLSQFIGGSSVLVGQSIPMQGALANFTDGSMEFLRSGYLKTYSSNYAVYKNRNPGGCYVTYTKTNPGTTSYLQGGNINAMSTIHYDGVRYMAILGDSNAGSTGVYFSTSTDLINWANSTYAGGSNTLTAVYDSNKFGTTIIISGLDSTNYSIKHATQNGSWVSSSSSTGQWTGIAVNTANTLGMVIKYGFNTNSTDCIQTTTNGTSWTSRTGTGGTSYQMYTSFWCPCANAFYVLGSTSHSGNLYLNRTTDGFTMTASVSNDSSFKVSNTSFLYDRHRRIASSPTVTLISNGEGLLKRTTDGTTWTTVNIRSQIGVDTIPESGNYISYDASSSKFYFWIGLSANGTRFMSSTDGLTWTPGFSFIDNTLNGVAVADQISTVCFVNNKRLFLSGVASIFYVSDVTSDFIQTNPDFIGIPAATIGDVPAYTRIL